MATEALADILNTSYFPIAWEENDSAEVKRKPYKADALLWGKEDGN